MSLSASPVVYKTAAITTIVMIKIITFNMIIIHVHDNTWYSKKQNTILVKKIISLNVYVVVYMYPTNAIIAKKN